MSWSGVTMEEESPVAYVIRWFMLLGIVNGFGQVSAQGSPTSSTLVASEKEGWSLVEPLYIQVTTWYGHWAYGFAGAVVHMLRQTQLLGRRDWANYVLDIGYLEGDLT